MVVLIDVDDVLNKLCEIWCEVLNERYGTHVSYKDITEWDMTKSFPWLTTDQVYQPLREPEIWDMVAPKDGTVEYVKKLIDEGFDVYLCTTTDYRNVQHKFERFIQRYYPYISWDRMIVVSKKQMIKADFLIDDGAHNLKGGDYIRILIDAPHNRSIDALRSGMIRVHSFKDAYNLITAIKRFVEVPEEYIMSIPAQSNKE